jgi:hypothetical protein
VLRTEMHCANRGPNPHWDAGPHELTPSLGAMGGPLTSEGTSAAAPFVTDAIALFCGRNSRAPPRPADSPFMARQQSSLHVGGPLCLGGGSSYLGG